METKKYQEFVQTSQSDSQVPSLSVKGKFLLILAKNSAKTEIKPLPLCAISLENSSYSQIFCELLSLKNLFDSNSFQTPSNLISLKILVTLSPFTQFRCKNKKIKKILE